MECPLHRRLVTREFKHGPNYLALASLPTAINRATWLDGAKVQVWIKRDDQASALYGGGKVRKLEWILADKKFAAPRPIVSVGATGSHHLLALALHLRQQNRPLHALVFPQVLSPHVSDNFAAMVSSGAKIWPISGRLQFPWGLLAYYGWDRPNHQGRFLSAGGSTVLGSLGFVEAGLELAEQVRQQVLPQPTHIYMAAGTAGTAAGLAIGLALGKMGCHLRLVSAVEKIAFNSAIFRWKLKALWRYLVRISQPHSRPSLANLLDDAKVGWSIDHVQVGPGYGIPTPDSLAAVDLANQYDLDLETTYTGKALAGFIEDRDRGRLPNDAQILFWNTHASIDVKRYVVPDWQERIDSEILIRLGIIN